MKETKHYDMETSKKSCYNVACGRKVNPEKRTRIWKKVTCKQCLGRKHCG